MEFLLKKVEGRIPSKSLRYEFLWPEMSKQVIQFLETPRAVKLHCQECYLTVTLNYGF